MAANLQHYLVTIHQHPRCKSEPDKQAATTGSSYSQGSTQLQLHMGKLKHESRPASAYSIFSRAATTSNSSSAFQQLPFTLLLISGAAAAFRGSKNGRATNFRLAAHQSHQMHYFLLASSFPALPRGSQSPSHGSDASFLAAVKSASSSPVGAGSDRPLSNSEAQVAGAASNWRPGNLVYGRPASPKSFRKVSPAQQVTATLNLSSEVSSIGTRPILAIEHMDAEAKHEVPVVRELPADSAGESLELVIPLSPPTLNQDVAERLGLEDIVSNNSFMILRDLKTSGVNDPPEQVALITKNGIPSKTISQGDPLIDSSSISLLPLDPTALVLDSLTACVEESYLVTSSQPSDVKAVASCVDDALSYVDHGLVSNPSKSESVPGVPILDVHVRDQLEGYSSEAYPAELFLNSGVDDTTPESIVRITRKYSLDDEPNIVASRDFLAGGHRGEDQIAIQEDLTPATLTGCGVVEDNATVAVCLADNPAQPPVVSEAAEVDFDPLSLGIKMLIMDNNFRLSLDALTPVHKNLHMGCSVVLLPGGVALAKVKNVNEPTGDDQITEHVAVCCIADCNVVLLTGLRYLLSAVVVGYISKPWLKCWLCLFRVENVVIAGSCSWMKGLASNRSHG
ncbi:hypothetical protein Nepgr_018723 [Nepenthes gracilis]|uniref:Uncharacterized protein n=1 Tax=Nepenthes gracilis TaxID=150966 RepID=A0AAD3STL3_NEPGR|nr:hypothetical protein Nepgr_018723 [Nepenthes gracilis]